MIACAASNTAVDNVVEKVIKMNVVRLGHPARIHGKILSACLYQKIKSSAMYKEIEKLRTEINGKHSKKTIHL